MAPTIVDPLWPHFQPFWADLTKNRFGDSNLEGGRHWQFVKELGGDKDVIVEFHSPVPLGKRQDVRFDGVRVRHKPPLGRQGVHGRTNREAIGFEQYPTCFEWEETV